MSESLNIFSSMRGSINAANTPCPLMPPPVMTSEIQSIDLCMGWFWTPEYEFDRTPGILKVTVGYAGGATAFPTYKSIQDYTEALRIEFDTKVLSLEDVLEEYYTMQAGGPTYPPYSRQYRSVILYHNDEQKSIAEKVTNTMIKIRNGKKVYVDIEAATDFYKAEEYHQKYVEKSSSSRKLW